MKITCRKCGRTWEYTGKNPYWATCTFCRTLNKIREVNKNAMQRMRQTI